MGGGIAAYRPEAVHFQFPLSVLSRTSVKMVRVLLLGAYIIHPEETGLED